MDGMKRNESGASEVIGAVLLVALVVVGGTVVAAFVFGQPAPKEVPHVSFGVSLDADNDELTLHHTGGDTLHPREYAVTWYDIYGTPHPPGSADDTNIIWSSEGDMTITGVDRPVGNVVLSYLDGSGGETVLRRVPFEDYVQSVVPMSTPTPTETTTQTTIPVVTTVTPPTPTATTTQTTVPVVTTVTPTPTATTTQTTVPVVTTVTPAPTPEGGRVIYLDKKVGGLGYVVKGTSLLCDTTKKSFVTIGGTKYPFENGELVNFTIAENQTVGRLTVDKTEDLIELTFNVTITVLRNGAWVTLGTGIPDAVLIKSINKNKFNEQSNLTYEHPAADVPTEFRLDGKDVIPPLPQNTPLEFKHMHLVHDNSDEKKYKLNNQLWIHLETNYNHVACLGDYVDISS